MTIKTRVQVSGHQEKPAVSGREYKESNCLQRKVSAVTLPVVKTFPRGGWHLTTVLCYTVLLLYCSSKITHVMEVGRKMSCFYNEEGGVDVQCGQTQILKLHARMSPTSLANYICCLSFSHAFLSQDRALGACGTRACGTG